MVDMGITAAPHQIPRLHAAILADGPEIVPQQVGDHDQLRHLLRIRPQFQRHPLIPLPVRLPATGPLDGLRHDPVSLDAQK